MYKKGDLRIGEEVDSSTDYDTVYGAYLRHSCDAWVIGNVQEIQWLIDDLKQALDALRSAEGGKP